MPAYYDHVTLDDDGQNDDYRALKLCKCHEGLTRLSYIFRCEICSKLTIKTTKQRQLRRSGVFIVYFEHILRLFPVFILLTLNK